MEEWNFQVLVPAEEDYGHLSADMGSDVKQRRDTDL